MNKEKQIVSKLRFPDFNDEWEKDILGNRGDFTGGGTPSKSNESFWQGDLPWVSSSDINEDSIHKINISRFITKEALKKSATKIVAEDSLLIVSRVGVGKLAVSEKEICTSQDFISFTPDKDNLFFLGYYLKANSQLLLSFSQGMAIKGFTKDDISNLELIFPKNLQEQQKIANCLSSLDEVINAETEKLELLQDHKKGLLQQLFPQEGDVTLSGVEGQPKYRFPEFKNDGDWEETTIGKLGGIVTGKTPSTKDESLWNGEILFITPTDISEDKYQKTTNRSVSKTDKMKILPIGSIVYTCIASIGKIAITTKESITNQQINSVIPNKNIVSDFVYYLLVKLTPFIKSIPATSTLPIINKTEFSQIKCRVPNPKEQQKIADCLSSVDNLIEAQTQKIDDLQAHKKGLLQQLFPNLNDVAV